jgi:hypothetical protein
MEIHGSSTLGNKMEVGTHIISMSMPLEMFSLICLYYFILKLHGNTGTYCAWKYFIDSIYIIL